MVLILNWVLNNLRTEWKNLNPSFFMKIVSFGKRSTTNLELEVLLILEIFKKSEQEVINIMKEPHNTSCIDDETL